MFIFGREIGLAVTTGSYVQLSNLCPDRDLSKIGQLLAGDDAMDNTFKMAVIMSQAYESRKARQEPGYKPAPLTSEELYDIEFTEYLQLVDEVSTAIVEGLKTHVNNKPAKGSKKNNAK